MYRALVPAVVVALAAFLRAASAGDDAPTPARPRAKEEPPPVVLLTGFEPFGGAPTNASWETVRGLEGRTIAGHRVATALLPVVYDEMERPLLAAIGTHRPRIVVSLGVGTPVVQVERTARNAYHPAKPLDNRGQPPPRERLVPGGADAIPTGLPTDEILAALAKARIGARASDDAGGYLCNECFYRLMRAEAPGVVRRGFVHVPPVGAADPLGGTFTIERLRAAVEIVVAETVAAAAPKTAVPKTGEAPAKTEEPPGSDETGATRPTR